MSLRVASEEIVADLAAVGLAANLSSVALPDQYIVEASHERDPNTRAAFVAPRDPLD